MLSPAQEYSACSTVGCTIIKLGGQKKNLLPNWTPTGYNTEPGGVLNCNEIDNILKNDCDRLVVLDFCDDSKTTLCSDYAPLVDNLRNLHGSVRFLKVNVSECTDSFKSRYKTESYPTYIIVTSEIIKYTFQGTDKKEMFSLSIRKP